MKSLSAGCGQGQASGRHGEGTPASEAGLAAGLCSWMFCSVGMLVFNKLAIKVLPTPCTLVGFQFAFTSAAMVVCCHSSLRVGSARDALRWATVVPFFTGMILTSILALKYAPMTLVVTFRALSPTISLLVERWYPSPIRVSRPLLLSLFGMILGMGMFVWDLPAASFHGVGWAVLNNFFAVGDRLLQRLMLSKEQSPVDISMTGVTLLNNSLGCIPLLLAAYLTSEFGQASSAVLDLDAHGWALVIMSCVVSVGISYSGVFVQSLITATSFLVLVNTCKFAVVFLDFFVMREKTMGPLQVVGSCVSILAGVAFGKARELAEAAEAAEVADATRGSALEEEGSLVDVASPSSLSSPSSPLFSPPNSPWKASPAEEALSDASTQVSPLPSRGPSWRSFTSPLSSGNLARLGEEA